MVTNACLAKTHLELEESDGGLGELHEGLGIWLGEQTFACNVWVEKGGTH